MNKKNVAKKVVDPASSLKQRPAANIDMPTPGMVIRHNVLRPHLSIATKVGMAMLFTD